jgi:hypothetical protein
MPGYLHPPLIHRQHDKSFCRRVREPGFYKNRVPEIPIFHLVPDPNPPAKTFIFSRSTEYVPICRLLAPKSISFPGISLPFRRFPKRSLRPQPKQGTGIFHQKVSRGAEKATGNPLFERRCSAHGEHCLCAIKRPRVSRETLFCVIPRSARDPDPSPKTLALSCLGANVPISRVRVTQSLANLSLLRKRVRVFGKRVQGENPFPSSRRCKTGSRPVQNGV